MKKIKNLLLATFALITLNVTAQTADEIIAKNTEAMGGAAKISSLTSVRKSGNLSAQGMDIPIVMTTLHLQGMRVDIEIMGTSNYQIMTPEKGYMFFPIQQMTEPKELDAETVKSVQNQLDVQGPLFNYKEKGNTLEYIATEKVEGSEAYKLKLTGKNGKTSFYFIDAKSNRVVKVSGKNKGPDGQEVDLDSVFSDYKQNADGYWFAYATSTPQGPITFDKIETNIKVDVNIFKN